jgi:alpha-L-fucosidase
MIKKTVWSGVAIGLLGVASVFAATEEEQRIAMAQKSQEISMNFPTEGFEFKIAEGPFKPKNDGFAEHYECPDWFRDVKFGIYSHWGVCTVPGYDGHYGRHMYHQERPQAYRDDQKIERRPMSGHKPGRERVYEYHVKNFGHPSTFGYKDFIPMWKAEKFDAMELAAFFKEIGAKYFGVMAVHHDNFDNYDSTYNKWNSVNMGPKKDIVGEWKTACEAHGLRFGITSHLANHTHEHLFFQGEADTKGPLKGVPYDTMDSANDSLYGYRTPDRMKRINPGFAQSWYLRTKDLIDKYDPDMLYLDGGIPNGDYGFNLAAHYYNQSILRNNGKLEGVFAIKRTSPKGFTLDREMHAGDTIEEKPWQTDTSMNPGWFYMGKSQNSRNKKQSETDDAGMGGTAANKTGDTLRLDAGMVVDNLIDIVSKNGNMLLNVGLRADGSLPETYRDELLKIGKWLKVNGDGIYETRPYKIFGEGPFSMPKTGRKYNDHNLSYSSKDIRFTTKGDTLYAFMLTWSENNRVLIKSLSTNKIDGQKIASVTMLGSGETLKFKQTQEGLLVMLPKAPPSEYAHGLKIDGLKL